MHEPPALKIACAHVTFWALCHCVASSTACATHVGFSATRTATAIWIFKGFLPGMLWTLFYLLVVYGYSGLCLFENQNK